MRKFLFRKPPDILALFIVLPILIHTIMAYHFKYELNLIVVIWLAIVSIIMFQVFALIRELDPDLVYEDDQEVTIVNKILPHDEDDVTLEHLQILHELSQKSGVHEIIEVFATEIDNYLLRQKIQSMKKQDIDDDTDGDVLV